MVNVVSDYTTNSRTVTWCRMKFQSVTRHRQTVVPGDYSRAEWFPSSVDTAVCIMYNAGVLMVMLV